MDRLENSECPSNKICHKNKCINPCISRLCGVGADCTVNNHVTYSGLRWRSFHFMRSIKQPTDP